MSAYSHIFLCFLRRDVIPSLRPLITWLEETVYCAAEGERDPSTSAAVSDMSFGAISWGTAGVRKGGTAESLVRNVQRLCVFLSVTYSAAQIETLTFVCLLLDLFCVVVCFS